MSLKRKGGGVRAWKCVLAVAMLCWVGCAHVTGTPEPPPTFTHEESASLERFYQDAFYPGVESVLEKFKDYACDNEAIAGRDTTGCDVKERCEGWFCWLRWPWF